MRRTTTQRWLAAWFATVLSVMAEGEVAEAQDARTEAREIATRATRNYNLGRFQPALEGYERAYERFPAPGLLFNLGQCHRELGHHERVAFFFERYLEEVPDSPNRALVQDLLAEARAAQARARAEEEAALSRGSEALRAQRERQSAALNELERARLALEGARTDGHRRREAERERYEAALSELEQARSALETARLAIARTEVTTSLPAVTDESDGRGGSLDVAIAAGPTNPEVYEEWWFWTVIVGVVVVGVGLSVGLSLGLEPQLPAGTLGTIDQR